MKRNLNKRKPTRRPVAARVALRVNGKPVAHGDGAKLAAAAIGCTQTTGSQCGQGNVRLMLGHIGEGNIALFGIEDLINLRADSGEIDAIADLLEDHRDIVNYIAEPEIIKALRATAAALRSAARLREANHETR